MSPVSRGFRGLHRDPAGQDSRLPPGQHLTEGFPVLSAGPHRTPRWRMDLLDHPGRPDEEVLDLAGIPGAAGRGDHCGHPLRDPLVQARHPVARGIGGHSAGPGGV